MKRLLIFTLCAIMLLSLAACKGTQTASTDPTPVPKTEAPVTTAEPTEPPTVAPAETPATEPKTVYGCFVECISVPVGEGEFDVHYQYPDPDFDEELCGPGAVRVIGGEVWILDSIDGSLLRFSDGEKNRHPLEGVIGAFNFFVVGGHIFVTDTAHEDKLFVFDMDVRLEKTIELPPEVSPNSAAVYQIYEADEENCITVLTADMDYLKCDIGTGNWYLVYTVRTDVLSPIKTFDFNGTRFSFETGENTLCQFLSVDLENGTIFVAINEFLLSEDDTFNIRTSYRQYDTKGNLLRYAELEKDPDEILAVFQYGISPDGTLSIMRGYEDRVVISRLAFDFDSD